MLIYPKYNKNHIIDVTSALSNTAFHLGDAIGPVLGSYLVDVIGFEKTNSLFGWIIVFICVGYALRFAKDFCSEN